MLTAAVPFAAVPLAAGVGESDAGAGAGESFLSFNDKLATSSIGLADIFAGISKKIWFKMFVFQYFCGKGCYDKLLLIFSLI